MAFNWRTIRRSELDACLDVRPARRGEALIGREAALNVWHLLLKHAAFRHAAIESDPPIKGHRIIGFGASVFVTPEFAERELANPQPDINSRVIESIHTGRSVLLTREQIGLANAGQGADLVILYGTWLEDLLDAAQILEATVASGASAVACHAGYRMRRILQETGCRTEEEIAGQTGVFKRHAEFPGSGRVLFTSGLEVVAHAPGTGLQMGFVYREPVLRLRESEQELLEAALAGHTDEELASVLGLSVTAVKARWRAIVSRLAERKWSSATTTNPAIERLLEPILNDDADASGRTRRGAQKRHRLIEYVRRHPEELRPYAWDPGRPPAEPATNRPSPTNAQADETT